jgi:hemolysin activation/secretion protein
MLNSKLIPCALLAITHSVFAQQLPSAGSQLQQIPPAPVPQRAQPAILPVPVAPVTEAGDAASVKITVQRLAVSGSTTYTENALLAATGFVPGSNLSLDELRAMAAKIAAYYHRNGYFLAQAYLPEQDIQSGVVTIAVLEGRYGKVALRNNSAVSDAVAYGLLGGLNNEDMVAVEPLEHRLLLLSDLPGVQVKSTLVPGASVGASDLIVELTPGQRISGSVDADNAGNRYTGRARGGATVNLNEPTGHGDVATLRVLTSGSGLNYARLSYQAYIGNATAGVAYSALRYKLGREFAPLDADGKAMIASVYGSYPLIRSRNTNLYVQLNADAKRFSDELGVTSSVTDKHAHVLIASLVGDAFDTISADSNGHYNKLSLNATRQQSLTDTVSLYAAINGQLASKNLDVSEKMELGGMYGVRAYPEGEAYADQGYVINLEARVDLQRLTNVVPGQLQLIGFVDHGSVTTNKNPWTAGSNRRTLSGAGVGLVWGSNSNVVVRTYYAHRLGNEKALSAPDSASRFWVQAVKYF